MTETSLFQQEYVRIREQQLIETPQWAETFRQEAMNRFLTKGLPTTKDEEWRFTNITPLLRHPFRLPGYDSVSDSEVKGLVDQAVLNDQYDLHVFVNGWYSERWSRSAEVDSAPVFVSLAESIRGKNDSVGQRLIDRATDQESAFVSLNSAFLGDGACIQIPENTKLSRPIHLVFVSTADEPIASYPRNLISVGRNSEASIIETHVGSVDRDYFSNSVTDVVLGESAELQHHKLQQEQTNALHVATMRVHQRANSSFQSHYFALGGSLSRNEIECVLNGEEIECTLNGLYMPSGKQLMDCRTKIDHAQPNCRSYELYKGILDDQAKGVFNGKIYVHPHAQKTNAMQSNQAILLSDDAIIDTKPQLEIYADDVRCTHGATVGELDEESLYYLRSRGIPRELARKILIFAFANDVVQGLSEPAVRKRLESLLLSDHGLPVL